MLVLSRKVEEQIVFPDLGITIQVVASNRSGTRLGIDAPREIKILRAEIPAGQQKLRSKDSFASLMKILESHLDALDGDLGDLQDCLDRNDQRGFINSLSHLNVDVFKLNNQVGSTLKHKKVSGKQGKKRVLLIDDNTNESKLLGSYLKLKGAEVLTAADGMQAMQILEQPWNPDVVLLDMNMPVYDGHWTIQQIRSTQQFADLTVFAVSGTSEAESKVNVGPRGIDFWFQKPLNPEQLVDAISQSI